MVSDSSSAGMARMTSTARISTTSIHRPKKPEMIPMTRPAITASPTAIRVPSIVSPVP